MSNYVIWTHGLRGPEISVLHDFPALNEYERPRVMSGPTKIAPDHDGKPLAALAGLYPPPAPSPAPVAPSVAALAHHIA